MPGAVVMSAATSAELRLVLTPAHIKNASGKLKCSTRRRQRLLVDVKEMSKPEGGSNLSADSNLACLLRETGVGVVADVVPEMGFSRVDGASRNQLKRPRHRSGGEQAAKSCIAPGFSERRHARGGAGASVKNPKEKCCAHAHYSILCRRRETWRRVMRPAFGIAHEYEALTKKWPVRKCSAMAKAALYGGGGPWPKLAAREKHVAMLLRGAAINELAARWARGHRGVA